MIAQLEGTFVRHSRQWYASTVPLRDGVLDDIMVHIQCGDVGIDFSFELIDVDGIRVRLVAFDDAWRLMFRCPELIGWLASWDPNASAADDIETALLRIGFTELTKS